MGVSYLVGRKYQLLTRGVVLAKSGRDRQNSLLQPHYTEIPRSAQATASLADPEGGELEGFNRTPLLASISLYTMGNFRLDWTPQKYSDCSSPTSIFERFLVDYLPSNVTDDLEHLKKMGTVNAKVGVTSKFRAFIVKERPFIDSWIFLCACGVPQRAERYVLYSAFIFTSKVFMYLVLQILSREIFDHNHLSVSTLHLPKPTTNSSCLCMPYYIIIAKLIFTMVQLLLQYMDHQIISF